MIDNAREQGRSPLMAKSKAAPNPMGAPAGMGPPPMFGAAARPVATRRARPGMIALALSITAIGGLVAAGLWVQTGHRTGVLAVSKQLQAGQVVSAQDVVVADISLDPAVTTIPAGAESQIIGQRATTTLYPGALLQASDLSKQPVMTAGDQVVSIHLAQAQVPATPLVPGEELDIVYTPSSSAVDTTTTTTSTSAPPTTVPVTVVQVGSPDSSGDVMVDVACSSQQAAALAAQASTGDIAVLQGQGGS
jgi:hypothetical protein